MSLHAAEMGLDRSGSIARGSWGQARKLAPERTDPLLVELVGLERDVFVPHPTHHLERIGSSVPWDVHEGTVESIRAFRKLDDERPEAGLGKRGRQRPPEVDDVPGRPIRHPQHGGLATRAALVLGEHRVPGRQLDGRDRRRTSRELATDARDIDAPTGGRRIPGRLGDALTAGQQQIGGPRPHLVALPQLLGDQLGVHRAGFGFADGIDLRRPGPRVRDPTEVERHAPGPARILVDHGRVELRRRTADEFEVGPGSELGCRFR